MKVVWPVRRTRSRRIIPIATAIGMLAFLGIIRRDAFKDSTSRCIGILPNDSQVARWSVAWAFSVASGWALHSIRACISSRGEVIGRKGGRAAMNNPLEEIHILCGIKA